MTPGTPSGTPDSPILERVAEAEALFASAGGALARDPRLGALLSRYRETILHTRGLMDATGMVVSCGRCAQKSPGGCCFEGVETWFDLPLLLANLLLGVRVPRERRFPGACLFVGETGCTLLGRHAFCITFLCPDIKRVLSDAAVRRFLDAANRELQAGWECERALFAWLKAR